MSDFGDLSGEPWYNRVIFMIVLGALIAITTPIVYIAAIFQKSDR